jgi:putative phosphoribosyl transferase
MADEQGPFEDRRAGGRELARHLSSYAGREDVVTLALPRGGVPVAFEVAKALDVPLDVFGVRKLGVPGHEELAMGAIASGGVRVLNEDVLAAARVEREQVDAVTERERESIDRQERQYRRDRPPVDVRGRVAILVDDGLATGATMRAAIRALRERRARSVVVAVPTAPRRACAELEREADELVCPMTPEPFMAVGLWYREFSPTSDEEVRELLDQGSASGTRSSS